MTLKTLLYIPNLLTFFRLCCIPPVVWCSLREEPRWVAAGLVFFVLAVVTDWADGYLARKLGQTSRLGTLLDPATDKVLILSVLVIASERAIIPIGVVVANLFREFLVSDFRQMGAAQEHTIGANWMGKTKFALQCILGAGIYACLLLRASDAAGAGLCNVVWWGSVVVTAVSIVFAIWFFVSRAMWT